MKIAIEDETGLAIIRDWVEATHELFVELYYPHSGAGGTYYLVDSFRQFRALVAAARSGAIFFILREPQFPLRGAVDQALIDKARQLISEGERYEIIEPEFYPKAVALLGDGQTHADLQSKLEDCRGMVVAIGKEPPLPDAYWVENDDPNCVIALKH
jgi:hypothetical protein